MANILIVEDDKPISEMIAMHLQLAGHMPFCAEDTKEAKSILEENEIKLALLDIMLPGEDGFDFAPHLLDKSIPIIFLTARTSVADRVKGLKLGAEDYILKPFEPAELIARIDVVLRRFSKNSKYIDEYLTIDFDAMSVYVQGKKVDLTAMEFDLLSVLVRNKHIALNRETLLKTVWGYDYMGETRTVDVHMQRLRKKLGIELIETIYKYGYKYTGGSEDA